MKSESSVFIHTCWHCGEAVALTSRGTYECDACGSHGSLPEAAHVADVVCDRVAAALEEVAESIRTAAETRHGEGEVAMHLAAAKVDSLRRQVVDGTL